MAYLQLARRRRLRDQADALWTFATGASGDTRKINQLLNELRAK